MPQVQVPGKTVGMVALQDLFIGVQIRTTNYLHGKKMTLLFTLTLSISALICRKGANYPSTQWINSSWNHTQISAGAG